MHLVLYSTIKYPILQWHGLFAITVTRLLAPHLFTFLCALWTANAFGMQQCLDLRKSSAFKGMDELSDRCTNNTGFARLGSIFCYKSMQTHFNSQMHKSYPCAPSIPDLGWSNMWRIGLRAICLPCTNNVVLCVLG